MKGIIWLWKHRRRQMHTSVGGKVEPPYPWPKRDMPRPMSSKPSSVPPAREWRISPPPAPKQPSPRCTAGDGPFSNNEEFLRLINYWELFLGDISAYKPSWSIDAGTD